MFCIFQFLSLICLWALKSSKQTKFWIYSVRNHCWLRFDPSLTVLHFSIFVADLPNDEAAWAMRTQGWRDYVTSRHYREPVFIFNLFREFSANYRFFHTTQNMIFFVRNNLCTICFNLWPLFIYVLRKFSILLEDFSLKCFKKCSSFHFGDVWIVELLTRIYVRILSKAVHKF